MAEAKRDSVVKLHYTGKLLDGTPFDTSRGREPLEFRLGADEVIAGFDRGVVGMSEGETKEFEVAASEAYGAHRAELVVEVPKSQLPEGLDVEVGHKLEVNQKSGEPAVVRVVKVEEGAITIDGNHPLAGEDLKFEVELLEVKE